MAENEALSPLSAYDGTPSILIVEDNFINQKVAASMLEEFGLPILMADDGQQALDAMRSEANICLVLMDLQMPVMDGVTCARAIRAGQAGDEYQMVPIVALTANTEAENQQACDEVGMNGFLCKPINLPVFRETISKFLPHAQLHG